MQTDLRTPAAPGAAILNAPGSWRRITALVLSILAMLLPVLNGMTFGLPTSYHLPRTVPWTLLFPLVATAALLAPAIPAAAPWLRLLDIGSAVLGGAISTFVVLDMMQANQGLNAMAGAASPSGRSLQAQFMSGVSLGIGAYALFAATAAALLAALARSPRAAA